MKWKADSKCLFDHLAKWRYQHVGLANSSFTEVRKISFLRYVSSEDLDHDTVIIWNDRIVGLVVICWAS